MSEAPPHDWSGVGSNRIEQVVEALVFASDEPISPRRIGDIYADVTGEDRVAASEIEEAVRTLNERYSAEDRPLRIEEWAGGYRMATVPQIAPFVKALFQKDRERRLSRSLMETLAILAYRQPVTKPEVDFVRGVDSDYAMRKLLELGLADVVGRADSVGRPLLYGTTEKFLEIFGLNDLEGLPNLREIETILDDPAFHKEKAKLLMKSGALPGGASDAAALTEGGGGGESSGSESSGTESSSTESSGTESSGSESSGMVAPADTPDGDPLADADGGARPEITQQGGDG